MISYIVLGNFIDDIISYLNTLIDTFVGFVTELLRMIPILFQLFGLSQQYNQRVLGLCAILTPFIIVYEIRLILGIIRSVT